MALSMVRGGRSRSSPSSTLLLAAESMACTKVSCTAPVMIVGSQLTALVKWNLQSASYCCPIHLMQVGSALDGFSEPLSSLPQQPITSHSSQKFWLIVPRSFRRYGTMKSYTASVAVVGFDCSIAGLLCSSSPARSASIACFSRSSTSFAGVKFPCCQRQCLQPLQCRHKRAGSYDFDSL